MFCFSCDNRKLKLISNLGNIPLSNNFVKKKDLLVVKKYPLKLYFCPKCKLVQTKKVVSEKNIFNAEYLYHSSFSKTWIKHVNELCRKIVKNNNLKKNDLITEIASNDGYLLKYFKKRKFRKILGIEPSKKLSNLAKKNKIEVITDFFSTKLIKSHKHIKFSKIIIGLNVLAHTPNLKDFSNALSETMNSDSVGVFEIQYLPNLIKKLQFDTIYHEHYSYFTLTSLVNLFKKTKIGIFKVEFIKTHGGSIRIYLKRKIKISKKEKKEIQKILGIEKQRGLHKYSYYKIFDQEFKKLIKKNRELIKLILNNNSTIYGYGAAAKSTIWTNIMGLNNKNMKIIFDKNPYKSNKYIPGTNILIKNDSLIKKIKPKNIIIFTWNLKEEIIKQLKFLKKIKTNFITFEPYLKIYKQ